MLHLGPSCQLCQRSKVSRSAVTTFCDFALPPSRFLQIHIDLVGPLPSSAGFLYCLTALDPFTRCSATYFHSDITAATVTRALLSGSIYHFGCPQTMTTDQGRQFILRSSTAWPSCVVPISTGRVLTTLPPMASWNGYTARLKPPSCAMQRSNGPRLFRQFYTAYAPPTMRTWSYPQQNSSMASPCGFSESSLIHPPRRSGHLPSYSSSAAAWTSCDQPRQHAIHTLPRSSTVTSRIRPTYFYGRTPSSAPWTHHTASRTDKTFKIFAAAGRSPCQACIDFGRDPTRHH
jgi:hypothetical protein